MLGALYYSEAIYGLEYIEKILLRFYQEKRNERSATDVAALFWIFCCRQTFDLISTYFAQRIL
jgi:hypothetical protein